MQKLFQRCVFGKRLTNEDRIIDSFRVLRVLLVECHQCFKSLVPRLGQNCGEHHLGINSTNVLECGVGPNLVKTNGTLVSKGMKANTTVGYANAFTCGLKIKVSLLPHI